MGLKKILEKKVSFLWKVAAIIFWVLIVVELIMLILAGSGFNSLTNFIAEGHISCAEYCESKEQPLYLHDVITQACQCYDSDEEPTDYKNLQTGVEIQYTEDRQCQT